MYEELVKRLRAQAEAERFYDGEEMLYEIAADAIESTNKAYQMISEAYEAEVTKQNWIPVTERLPEPGWYLVRCNEVLKHIHRIAHYYDTVWYENGNNITKFVTHWISFPEPPKEEK